MTKGRRITLLIVATHWIVAIWHLFLAANLLPAPNNSVSGLAVTLITSGHLVVSIGLWKFSDKVAGVISLIFFVAASTADIYEHFLHPSANNVFMVARGEWTTLFDGSVIVLLALEILGCLFGISLLSGRAKNSSPPPVAGRSVMS